MTQEKIIFSIPFSEDQIQDFTETHYNRKLTETEINDIREHWNEAEEIGFAMHDIIKELVKSAIESPTMA